MKVLFAVNDENISTSIVKKYQKQYKEIISYKNVYYFNAILKELQRNKSYDRIVIGEDLEEFSSSSYAQKDKFIFDRLDNISDEAVTASGNDIPIILICSERRTKSEEILIKLFGIGVYNAIIGDDRSIDEVCRLINKPRSKKEAKFYYKIESEDVSYEKGNESDVSEVEMRNILMHFKKLGSNEDRYVESFNNIVSQYNDAQMKVIIAILPASVKAVLEENSAQYRKIAGISSNKAKSTQKVSSNKGTSKKGATPKKGTSEKLLREDNTIRLSKPVVVPTTMENSLYKKVNPKKKIDFEEIEDEIEENVPEIVEEVKPKRRGRPRKNPIPEEETIKETTPKRRGRPRKNPLPEEVKENPIDSMLPGFYEEDDNEEEVEILNNNYKGINKKLEETTILPGFEEDEDENVEYENYEEDYKAEDYEEEDYDNEDIASIEETEEEDYQSNPFKNSNNNRQRYAEEYEEEEQYDNVFDDYKFENLLTEEKRIIAFVGTSKNGTSFIVNNVAQILSNRGINTAIFDATQNKNAYYIYTKNEEDLRKTAVYTLENLKNERAKGIKANNNLTIYTNIPTQNDEMKNTRPILETLVKNHSVVLIDCDFNTPLEYFSRAQEIYLIQSMDVLTIQPLTAFLNDLKAKGILDERKIRIVLNKLLRIRGVSSKNIIGGMSNYNDPEMSFMTELFDRNLVKVVAQIPFDEDVYAKYLENLIECEMRTNGYPKEFKQRLNGLAEAIYPSQSTNNKKGKREARGDREQYANTFSTGMNNTLDNMRKRY